MTPFEINLILHIYACPGRFPQKDAPIYSGAISKLKQADLIRTGTVPAQTGDHPYKLTERGALYVQMLCDLKPPTAQTIWVDQHGREVELRPTSG